MMLDNPVLENPVNLQAAKMFQSRPKRYRQMVFDSVVASKRVEGKFDSFTLLTALLLKIKSLG